jgi:hypothetical protein
MLEARSLASNLKISASNFHLPTLKLQPQMSGLQLLDLQPLEH